MRPANLLDIFEFCILWQSIEALASMGGERGANALVKRLGYPEQRNHNIYGTVSLRPELIKPCHGVVYVSFKARLEHILSSRFGSKIKK